MSAHAVERLAAAIDELRRSVPTAAALLEGLAELAATLKAFDDEIDRGELLGVSKIRLQVTGGLDLDALAELTRTVARHLDRLSVRAGDIKILKPAMGAGVAEGESEQ